MFKFNVQLLKEDIKKSILAFSLIVLFVLGGNLIAGKVCYFRMLTGLPCAGCGITRAFGLAFQLKFKEATIMHPFWIALVILFIWFIVGRYFITDKEVSKKVLHILNKCAIIIVILCFAYYIYRMVVWYPNREPMMYDPENTMNMLKRIFN